MKSILIFALLIVLKIQTQNSPAGLLVVRPEVITKFKNWFLPQFIQKVGKPTFPEMRGGGAKVRNLRVETLSIDVPSTNIVFQEGILLINVQNLHIGIKGDFEFKKAFIKIGGRISANSRGAKLSVGYSITLDAQRKLVLTPVTVHADVNHFDLDIGGNVLADILNFIKDLFKGEIKHQVNKHLKEALADALTKNLNSEFQKVNYQQKVLANYPVSIDFEPSQAPVIKADRFELFSNAYFFNSDKIKTRPPFPLPQIPTDLTAHNIQLTFDQYFINSFIFAAYDSGMLQESIQSEEVPQDSLIQLTSDGLGGFIPELTEKYGDGKKIDINLRVPKLPIFELSTNKAELQVQINLEFMVRKSEAEVEKAFSIKTNFVFAISLRVENNVLKGKILNAQFTFVELIDPKIMPFDPNVLKDLVNDSLGYIIEQFNNNQLKVGIPINNIKNINLVDAQVILGEKHFKVVASPEFSGTI